MPRPRNERTIPKIVARPGRRNLYLRYTDPDKGFTAFESTGTDDPDIARRYLDEWLKDRDALPDAPTVAEVLDRYLRSRKGLVQDYPRLEAAAAALKADFGGKQVDSLTLHDIETHRTRPRRPGYKNRTAPAGPIGAGTARRSLSLLKTACAKTGVPLLDFDLPSKPPPRDKWLSKPQADALLAACETYHLKLAVRLCLATGCRIGAALALTWDRVDLDHGVIDFNEEARPVTKKRRAVVPVGRALKAALQDAMLIRQSNHVIEWKGRAIKRVSTAFNKARDRAGLPWLTPHYLKHTAISWFAEQGYTADEIADYTETDPETVRRIYRKINPENLRSMANATDSFLSPADSKTLGKTRKAAELRRRKRAVSKT